MSEKENKTIVLCGFMGTGKTTTGRLLAAKMNRLFIDTDDEIIRETGIKIDEIFKNYGEEIFRKIESRICQEFACREKLVIAAGGGALSDENTLEIFLKSCFTLRLDCKITEIMKRIGNEKSRPLFSRNSHSLSELLAARSEAYAKIPISINTTNKKPENVVEEILRLWNGKY